MNSHSSNPPFRFADAGRFLSRLVVLLFLASHCWLARALILTGDGNAPVQDMGWPAGSLAVANLPSRVGWSEGPPFGGGQWTFYNRGDTSALQEAIQAFAGISAGRLELVLREGRPTSPFLKPKEGDAAAPSYDWSFQVWVPVSWNQLFNQTNNYFASDQPGFRQPVPAPRLDVWLHVGGPEWDKVVVPDGITVRDQRATSNGFALGSGNAVSVRITDAAGAPLSGARLVVLPQDTEGKPAKAWRAASDAMGRATVAGLPAGTFDVRIEADGYAARRVEWLPLGENEFHSYAVPLVKAVVLEGVAQDKAGTPVAGVQVQIRSSLSPDGMGYPLAESTRVVSGPDGRFRIPGLPAGAVQLWASKAGYYNHSEPSVLIRLDGVSATGSFRHELTMERTGAVRVRLADLSISGVPGAVSIASNRRTISIQQADRWGVGSWGGGAELDATGAAVFREVPPGRYRVATEPITEDRIPKGAVTVVVESGRTNEVVLPR